MAETFPVLDFYYPAFADRRGWRHSHDQRSGRHRTRFRDTNIWLQMITNNAVPRDFYLGDALGSLNSWMRLSTGTLFGIALVAFAYPYINQSFTDIVRRSEATFMKGFGQ